MKRNYKVMSGKALVRQVREQKKGVIILQADSQKVLDDAEVLQVGDTELESLVGKTVVLNKFAGVELEDNGDEVIRIIDPLEDILAIVEGENN